MEFGGEGTDRVVAHLDFNAETVSENQVLTVKCMAPGLEIQDSIWEHSVDQLSRYFDSPDTSPSFGALAVGEAVLFFKWDRDNRQLVDFQDDGTIYYIDRQCQTVTTRLEYFRDHH
jgi:hypothetical protein